MANTGARKDLLDILSNFIAHNKGLPVLAGVGLIAISLVLTLIPGLSDGGGFWGWLVRNQVLLHLGAIVGLLGMLIGDAL